MVVPVGVERRAMPLAPAARNLCAAFVVDDEGKLKALRAADEASITQHEFYILCAALSVRWAWEGSEHAHLPLATRSCWMHTCHLPRAVVGRNLIALLAWCTG